jgi:hypothetical protein
LVLDAYTKWQSVNVDLAGKLQKAQIDLAPAAALASVDSGALVSTE